MIFVLGINGFIARNFYIYLKKLEQKVTCLSHDDIDKINITNDDVIINFCGVNRGKEYSDFDEANHIFIKNLINKFNHDNKEPHLIHISSLMIYGFLEKTIDQLPKYQQNFIKSKSNGEKYLLNNYPNNKLCIIRPSNIYGYDCEPYYNNILVTLIYEKIVKIYKTNKINENCTRNFLSINGLCDELFKITKGKICGIYNVISNNNINLKQLTNIIYQNNVPTEIIFESGDKSISAIHSSFDKTIIYNEDLESSIRSIENNIEKYIKLNNSVEIKKINVITQTRGDMIEITSLPSNRLYMITLSDNSVRGNHYHYQQIEHFFQYNGKVLFLLAHRDNPDVILSKIILKNNLIVVNPLIIHTLINDFPLNTCEIIISSTQKYIKDEIPDTTYVKFIS